MQTRSSNRKLASRLPVKRQMIDNPVSMGTTCGQPEHLPAIVGFLHNCQYVAIQIAHNNLQVSMPYYNISTTDYRSSAASTNTTQNSIT